jgi:hypothetical protein
MKNDYSSKIILISPVLDIAEVDSKCQCKTFLKHWENTNKCSVCLCTALDCNSGYEGIYKVIIKEGNIFEDEKAEYIAPLCIEHSRMESPFKIKFHNPIVSINELQSCGKENYSLF